MSCIYVKHYRAPSLNVREILRYAGSREEASDLLPLLRECLAEIEGKLSYRICYGVFPVSSQEEWIDLGFSQSNSKDLRKTLFGCEGVIVFGATVGIEMDRLIARSARISPAKALMLQSIGAERVESLCRRFELDMRREYEKKGWKILPRFSAGYGDIPLTMQREILDVLNATRKIGVSLNQSLLMSPSKSVTAMLGIRAIRGRELLPLEF